MASKIEMLKLLGFSGKLLDDISGVMDEINPYVRWYILDKSNKPQRATLRQWSEWRASNPPNFYVGSTYKGNVWVSTVFLGLDHGHSFRKKAPPILFETMIFDIKPRAKKLINRQKSRNYQTRCSTWAQALKMHEEGVKAAWEPKIV
jgi:hypothetical protein